MGCPRNALEWCGRQREVRSGRQRRDIAPRAGGRCFRVPSPRAGGRHRRCARETHGRPRPHKSSIFSALSTALFIEKTLDAASGTFTERAVQVSPSKKQVTDVTMTLTVKGQNFTIKDSLGTMTGTGTLQGPAWAWTFLSADYVITANGMKIHD